MLTIALGVMGIGLFAITPIADNAAEEAVRSENLHNIEVQLIDVNLTGQNLEDLRSIENIKDVEPKRSVILASNTKINFGKREGELRT